MGNFVLKDIKKVYPGDVVAVSDFNLEINDKEFLVLVGPCLLYTSGGSSEFGDGESFMANIPTEEIFTMPHRDRVNGRIAATLPLSWQGLLIRDFWFQFENGVVTDFGAAEGRDVLERMLATDDSANRLGEAALVSVD